MSIEIQNLSKAYRGKNGVVQANDRISFAIAEKRCVGIFGTNGCGKTTLVRQILGIVQPDDGQILIDGMSLINLRKQRNYPVGYVSQTAYASLWLLKVRECFQVIADLRKISRDEASKQQEDLFKYFGLPTSYLDRIFYTLSGGQRRMICLCLAFVGNPKYMILDEPSNDLDPEYRIRLWQYLAHCKNEGMSVVLVTHSLAEVESVIDEFALLDQGKLVSYLSIHEMKEKYQDWNKIRLYYGNQDCFVQAEEKFKYEPIAMRSNTVSRMIEIFIPKHDYGVYRNMTAGVLNVECEGITLEDYCFGISKKKDH